MPIAMPYLRFDLETVEAGSRLIIDRKAATGRCRERVFIASHKLLAVDDHTRRDGSAGTLMTWQSECGQCGAPFEQVTGADFKGFMRRCGACRKAAPRAWASFPKGPRNRYTLYLLGERHPYEVDPASLF